MLVCLSHVSAGNNDAVCVFLTKIRAEQFVPNILLVQRRKAQIFRKTEKRKRLKTGMER